MWLRTDRSSEKDMVVKLGVHTLSDWEDDIVITRSVIAAIIHEGYDANTLKSKYLNLSLGTLVVKKVAKSDGFCRKKH